MNCELTAKYLDDFLDGTLDSENYLEVQSHIKSCKACGALLNREQDLRKYLRELPVPPLRTDFVRSALNKAKVRHEQAKARKYGMGGALAVGFVLFLAANLLVTMPVKKSISEPEVTLSKGQIHDIKLVFNSKKNIDGATFTVRLPGNVALKGFPDRQAISWKGRLKQGKNLLVLPVMATGPVEGDLITSIEHAENKKAFHVGIRMNEGNQSRSSYHSADMA